jgi:ribose-phosphate pyrophosphokinase
MKKIKIFAGSSHPKLAKKICQQLNLPSSPLKIRKYANGCFEVFLKDEISQKIVFLIQTSVPQRLHENLWELFQMINAAKRNGAKEIVVVMPYVSYARSDKIHDFGMTITGKLLVKLLEESGMTRFIGIDFHSELFERFFSKAKVYHLSALPLIANYLATKNLENAILLPGDEGALKRGTFLARKLKIPLGFVKKTRISDTQVKIEKIIGGVRRKDIILVDDEISPAATTLKTLGKKLEKCEAKNLTVTVTHSLIGPKTAKNLQQLKILKEIIVTDTVPISKKARNLLPLKVLSVAELLSDAIKEVIKEITLS